MDEEQEVLQLAAQTMMTQREARAFLWLVADWQRNHPLSEAAMTEVKQTAIESAARIDDSPLAVLQALYQAYMGYQQEQTRESFTKAMEFKAGIRRLEQDTGKSEAALKAVQHGLLAMTRPMQRKPLPPLNADVLPVPRLRSIDRQAWQDVLRLMEVYEKENKPCTGKR